MKDAFVLLLAFGACAVGTAQQAPSSSTQPAGTVTGHVSLADTNTPARMATVLLQPVMAGTAAISTAGPGSQAPFHMTGVQTLLDGSFAFQNVAPGTYYVLASSLGYMSPAVRLGLGRSDFGGPFAEAGPTGGGKAEDAKRAAEKQRLLDQLPKVTVQASSSASVDVSLERGGAISGTVLFDDGSPAVGLWVSPLVRKGGKWVGLEADTVSQPPPSLTDDQGAYRVVGLPAGDYVIEVDLSLQETLLEVRGSSLGSSGTAQYSLPVYSGGVFRTSDAVSFHVRAGQTNTNGDFQIPLGKLHTVSGTVTAARDGHQINGGYLSLVYADDHSAAAHVESSPDRPDSSFTFAFVPEGDYLLSAVGVSDEEMRDVANPPGMLPASHREPFPTHLYGEAELPLHVGGNIVGLEIRVPEKPTTGAQPAQ